MSVPSEQGQGDLSKRASRPTWIGFLPLAVVAVGVLVFLIWPIVTIQLRLSRNGATARQLVESLHSRFPSVDFRGAASYEQEVIYITVFDRVDATLRHDAEQYLRSEKADRHIEPELLLRFVGNDLPDIKF